MLFKIHSDAAAFFRQFVLDEKMKLIIIHILIQIFLRGLICG